MNSLRTSVKKEGSSLGSCLSLSSHDLDLTFVQRESSSHLLTKSGLELSSGLDELDWIVDETFHCTSCGSRDQRMKRRIYPRFRCA